MNEILIAGSIMLGIACIFLVMAALFESMLFPLAIILGSILFSVFGVFLFFAITGTTFSFMASIGIMILIGVVVNNGIVLVDHINNLRMRGLPRANWTRARMVGRHEIYQRLVRFFEQGIRI